MKKIISFIGVFMLFTSFNANAVNTKEINEYILLKGQSCFSFYHGLFHEYYGGINLDNVGDFNNLVSQCQALFE
ncbi:hypothetical protein FG167_05875 [Lacinutrix sp. WUR7]|uniref:hypothetical protein n=1 Tax=Lacinutrix sp. WUR7 TaxID=2653681 RepID=UPI00193E9F3A|nr:hypothetical protein [Lacinutrix sp. WUR7]QRM88781.1 hypothetical protein FG167_05875 [Lacinutrix sp. WUR7]